MARDKLELRLLRTRIIGDACCGTLMVRDENGSWNKHCATLEDLPRDTKVYGETCIPEGTYIIKKREVLSGMTKRYRKIYGADFDFHLELQDVPNYKYVYIHHGNTAEHTDGYILLGKHCIERKEGGFVTASRAVYKPFYKMVSAALVDGLEVSIEIINEFIEGA